MRSRNAFTLIELLIVIVIIGILATAVLSAINPVEQIRKSQDASKRSDSAELLNAIERYYASAQNYPWAAGQGTCTGTAPSGAISGTPCWITTMETNGELKPEFKNRSNLTSLFVSVDSNSLVHICFNPASNSSINAPNSNKSSIGVAGTGATDTYLCMPE